MLKNCGDWGVRMPDTVFISDREVDYHTLLKVTQANFQLGNIKVHSVADGYVVVFAECEDHAKEIYLKRLEDLKQNIWSH